MEKIPFPKDFDFNKTVTLTTRYAGLQMGGISEKSVNEAIETVKRNIFKQLNIPEKYLEYTFDNYKPNENIVIFRKIKELVDKSFKTDACQNISMYLWGKGIYGVGKTHLLYASIMEYVKSPNHIRLYMHGGMPCVEYTGMSICALSEYDFLNKVKNTFRPDSNQTEEDVYSKLNSYKILCIDDVAKYTPANLDFYQRAMFQLVDGRYKKKLSLFLTGNKSLRDLAEVIGYATADRISEMTKGYQLEFKGESHRSEQGT
jgi:DNA replication protein DnaC